MTVTTLRALVTRKTIDLTRVAAEDLVRAAHPEVRRVDRGELWTFDVEGPEGEAEVRRLLETTTLVVNPNVHRVVVGAPPAPPPAAAGARLEVVVADRVDAKSRAVLRSARQRLGFGRIRDVRRAILGSLDVGAGDSGAGTAAASASFAAAAAAAERIGLAVAGPEGGLLANPHAQDVERKVVTA